jgi:glycosyltransferase involved in cell wall biosynthesis
MLLSVVIPVYNAIDYLEMCIQNILAQVEAYSTEIEIILVDDGSTDGSEDLCDRLCNNYQPMIKVVHQDNSGLLSARRSGYLAAKGEYIINCDPDDYFSDSAFQIIREKLKMYTPDVLLFNMTEVRESTQTAFSNNIFTDCEESWVTKKQIIQEYLQSYQIVSMCTKVFRRDCLNFDIDYRAFGRVQHGEDTLQSAEIFDLADTYYYVNKPLYNYRIGIGMTGKFDAQYFTTFEKVLDVVVSFSQKNVVDDGHQLVGMRVLSVTGRAITQLRYASNYSIRMKKEFLSNIVESPLLQKFLDTFRLNAKKMQRDHVLLLRLLMNRHFLTIVILLKIKNMLTHR